MIPCRPMMMPPVGKSGPGHASLPDQLVERQRRGCRSGAIRRVADLAQVVRRNVGRHADGDAVGAVDEQVGKLARQHERLAILAVVVVDEIDRFAVEVLQHLGGDGRQPGFGVPMGGGRQAGDGAEIALPVDQLDSACTQSWAMRTSES